MNEMMPDTDDSNWHIRLRRAIVDYFDEDELETICFDLRIDFEELEGDNKSQKTISLITLMARLGRIDQLIDLCSEMRPNVPWSELRTAAQNHPLNLEEDLDSLEERQSLPENSPLPKPASLKETPKTNLPLLLMIGVAAVVMLGAIAVLVFFIFVVRSPAARPSSTGEIEQTSSPSSGTAESGRLVPTPSDLDSSAVLLSEDFESDPAQDWHSINSISNPAVVRLADGNHALQIRQGVDALYSPAWDFEVSDYRVEMDVMVVDLKPETSIGWNARILSENPVGFCQGYRAEIGPDYDALHLITAPGENCDSIWNYETLNNGEFTLKASEWHHLRLDVIANRLLFYIDGDLALTGTDPANTYPSGGVGIIVFSSQEAYADNVTITSLEGNSP